MRRTELLSQLVARKSIDKLLADSIEPEYALKKSLGPWSLTALGIGAVIGSGIFTVIGTAMAGQRFDAPNIRDTPLLHYILHHTAMAGRPGRDRRWRFRWCWWPSSASLPGSAMRNWRR